MADPPAIVRRRQRHRPANVRVLLIGESAPAGGTHFYLANSNLFRAVLTAFKAVYGRAVPDGVAFLEFFQSEGYWLVDLASEPVNRMEGRPRAAAVKLGVRRIAKSVADTKPKVVVAVKKSIASDVVRAIDLSGVETEFVALPFPTMGWHTEFVAGLTSVVRRAR